MTIELGLQGLNKLFNKITTKIIFILNNKQRNKNLQEYAFKIFNKGITIYYKRNSSNNIFIVWNFYN